MDYKGKILRHELKYSINNLEYAYLKSRLKALLKTDLNVNELGDYHIRSLYFDDLTNSSYNEKEDGVFKRKKYRIRIYNKTDNIIKLELKEKFGKYISKESRTISRKQYEEIINNKLNIYDYKDDLFLLEFYLQVKTSILRPKVIVDYLREPYICKQGNVRITFDKELMTATNTIDIFHSSPVLISPIMDGDMILEVKYDDFIPEYIRNLLSLARNQHLAISKYTICRDTKNAMNWGEKSI